MKYNSSAIVIGKNYSTSLGIIRALGTMNISVDLIKEGNRSFGNIDVYSKYVNNVYYVKKDSEIEIMRALLDVFPSKKLKKVLFPSDDYSAYVLDKNFDVLKDYYIIPGISDARGRLIDFMDKFVQKTIALECGMATSKGIAIKDYATNTTEHSISFPCFVKPQFSVGNSKKNIQTINNMDELNELSIEFNKKNGIGGLLCEEKISVEKEFVIPGLALEEEIIIPCVIEKKATGDGAHKGVTMQGILRNSNKYLLLVQKLKEFVKKIHFVGLFDIEILFSNGEYFFNEINLRNGAAGYALTWCGVNLPYIYYIRSLQTSIGNCYEKELNTGDCLFTSEKVAFENYESGSSSWQDYKKRIKEADCVFIKDRNDYKPYLLFVLKTIKTRLLKRRNGK